MKFFAFRDAVATQLGWRKISSRQLARGIARQLGVVAVAGGMSLGLASDGYAVVIPDAGFEDHVVDHSSGYAYGAAGQAGDPDGFNNPSSANGGVSPWQALGSAGNGIGGANASWIQNAGYAAPNSGNQSAEVQGLFAQNLTATFAAGQNYIATVAGNADGGDDDVVVSLYDAGAVTFQPTSTPALILTEPSLVTATPVVFGSGWSDGSFTFTAASLAGLVGKNIGIAVYSPDVDGQGPRIDDIRLVESAFENSLRVNIDRDTGAVTLNNFQGAAQAIKGYSILSSAGALIEENYTPLADSDSDWIKFTATGASGDLSEGHLTTGNIALGASIMLDNGADGAWLKYFDEDEISFEYLDGSNTLVQGQVSFSGTNQTSPYPEGDLNFDGDVNGLDWNVYVADLGSSFPGLSVAQAYRRGDLDGNGINNHADFLAFKNLFDSANGAGAFNVMLAGNPVPEPAALLLVVVAGLVLAAGRLARQFPAAIALAARRVGGITNVVVSFAAVAGSEVPWSKREWHPRRRSASRCVKERGLASTVVSMRTFRMGLIAFVYAMIGILFAGQPACAQLPGLMGLWEFDNASNLGDATVGNDLIFEGVAPTHSASLADDSAMSLNGVITTAAAVAANRIRADHGIAPNGGGTFVNQYTIVTDIFSPVGSRSSWRTIYQTNTGNGNDGEYFIRPDNDNLGVGELGYSTSPIDDTAWTRLVLSVDLTKSGGDAIVYLDGAQHYVHPGNPAVDGRFSLDPFMYFFTDENGDNAPLNVGTLAIFDGILTPLEVAALGVAGDPIGSNVVVPDITITVNKTTGNITMSNESGVALPQPINFYEIVSGDGVGGDGLLTTTGWDSLSDQSGMTAGINPVENPGSPTPGAGNDPGETWDEGGGSSVDLLTEAFLLGSTAVGSSFSVNLGNVYTGGSGGAENLSFNYSLENGTLLAGIVEYVTSASVAGDYNGNGIVDAADYTLWRDNLGAPNESAFAAGTGNGGGVTSTDYTFWRDRFGNTSGSGSLNAAAVPEPASWMLVGVAGLLILAARRRNGVPMTRLVTSTMAVFAVLFAATANAAVTNERNYTLGDDSLEDASAGITLGSGAGNVSSTDATLDSGDPGDPTGSYIDIEVNGDPKYISVSTRPGAAPGSLGASFDGVDDSLSTNFYMNRPSDFWDDPALFPTQEYPFNYETILSHGIQLWAKPNPAGLGQQQRQQLILDTTDGGGVYISEDDTWGLSYDDDANDQFVSTVAVDTSGNGWTHLMQLGGVANPVTGKSAAVGVLLVDGVAVVATLDVYDSQAAEPLVIGSNLAGDGEFYNGVIDDVRIFLWGDNTGVAAGPVGQQGQDYGALNLDEDNDYIAQQLAALGVTHVADVNLNGSVSGDGTGAANVDDVTAFVDNWMNVQTVNGIQIGDWNSRQNADLNYDGIVNLKDWAIVNAANPSMGAAIASALGGSAQVPEPGSLLLIGFGCVTFWAIARRR